MVQAVSCNVHVSAMLHALLQATIKGALLGAAVGPGMAVPAWLHARYEQLVLQERS